MIADQVIILPLFLPEGFPADFEKQTALFLSKKNKVIVFRPYEGITFFRLLTSKQKFIRFKKQLKTFKKNLISFPLLYPLPFHRFSFIRNLNYKIALKEIKLFTKIVGKRPIFWLFYPHFENLVGKFGEKLVIYDCVDFHSSPHPKIDKFKKKKEKNLIKKIDIVFTNSPALYRLKKKLHSKVFQVPQGANIEIFLKTSKQPLPKELKKIPKPIIGFTGNINFRLDFPLIKKLAFTHSEWSFVFVGPIAHDFYQDKIVNFPQKLKELKRFKNIYFISRKTKKQLVAYLDHFNICWIPYNVSQEFNRYSYPMKVFEYFCRGKPVVSTPIESLIPLQPYVKITKDAKDFEKEIKKILKNGWPEEYKKEQKKLALANSWEKKIEKISQILKKESPEGSND